MCTGSEVCRTSPYIPSDLKFFESSDSKQFIFKEPCELSDLVDAAPDLSQIVLFVLFFSFMKKRRNDILFMF